MIIKIKQFQIISLFWIALFFSSCASKFNRILRDPDVDTSVKGAFDFYDKKDYVRAGLILEDVLPNIMGNKSSEEVQFRYAYCHFYQNQFELSAHYFKSFYDVYRRSAYAKEAYFMYAYSLYKSTLPFYLDQSSTDKAIDAMQEFLNVYSESEFATQASEIIQTLRRKLERKAYQICMQYLKLRRYKATVVALDNFQKDFPDSDYKEEVSFLKLNAQYDLARSSLEKLKKERLEKTIEYYYYFIDKYPLSKYLEKAGKIFETCRDDISNLS